LHDRFFKQAKADGYAARSAYKLKQIQERFRLILPGQRVLDLGCAPGSWSQVAGELVGGKGEVVGIDLQPVDAELPGNAVAIVGDIFKTPAEALMALGRRGGGPGARFDTVISDMAPNTTGDPGGDHFRSVELCRRVLALLPALLVPGGSAAMKVFEGEEYAALLKECRGAFAAVKGFKPEATRAVSREMFIVMTGFRGAGTPRVAPTMPGPAPQAGPAAQPARTKQPNPDWGTPSGGAKDGPASTPRRGKAGGR
jgi:23S rRNA (uridine2552-2'-O)-methyltransferase